MNENFSFLLPEKNCNHLRVPVFLIFNILAEAFLSQEFKCEWSARLKVFSTSNVSMRFRRSSNCGTYHNWTMSIVPDACK